MLRATFLGGIILLLQVGATPGDELLDPGITTAQSPGASLKAIKVRSGFEVELVAAEPLVQSPIALAWGPDRKLWVVEMGDYPLGVDGKGKPGGRIKYLEDTNGDGKYVKATVFVDGLPFPTGVLPWRKGVLITCAPHIYYAEDTKGTGKADKLVPLYSGFREGNQQHRVNSLVWGLDNWIYCANGDSGGTVQSIKTGATVDIRGRDLRIRPDSGAIDLQSGQTQFGRSRDDWNNWFGNNNSWPLYHFALADHYIRRNPHVAAPESRVQVSVVPGASQIYPLSRTTMRFNDPETANHFTSACSAIIYRDELFGPEYRNSTFVSEPVHNLVHREVIRPEGTTFTSRRADDEQTSEFLASADNWFRPTSLQTGPDGALWIADMYRAVIEHPEWIPKNWQDKLDLRAGHDKGRIYRVYPAGAKPRQIPRLDQLDTAGLVAALDTPSGWQRDLAQMILIWRADKTAVPLLERLVGDSKRPLARVHALCTLDGLDALSPTVVQRALGDAYPGVRQHAVRLCEGRFAATELGAALAKMTADPAPTVRLQLAYTLGTWDDPRASKALGELALRNGGDRFIAAAVMSSLHNKNFDAMLTTVLANEAKSPRSAGLLENLARMALALERGKSLGALLEVVARPEQEKYAAWQSSVLAGLLDALDQRSSSLIRLRDRGDADLKATLTRLDGLFQAARARFKDGTKDEQLLGVRLLGRGFDHQREDLDLLAGLLSPQIDRDLQAAAIAALGRLPDPRVPEALMRGWKGYGPALRGPVLDVLFSRDERALAVLEAMERKVILASELDAARRQRLIDHKNPAIRTRAGKLLAGAIAPDRQKILDDYAPVLTITGNAQRGARVFAKSCAACHKLGDVGNIVGPDLASVGDKSPQGLLVAILDPNRVVEARYVNFIARTTNGQTFSGVLAGETGNSITLLAIDGKQHVILRSNLEELASTGKSVMPEGLEKDIPHQEMADLIAHVRSFGPQRQRKTFDGNRPERVRAGSDGSLLLAAASGEIYGTTLVFEKQHGTLTSWVSTDDHVSWAVQVPQPGRYAVWFDWACDDQAAGKAFVLQTGTSELKGRVESTSGMEKYRQAKVGEVVLAAGVHRVTVRSASRLFASPLLALKSVKLVPLPK